jgi:hypothetical protein
MENSLRYTFAYRLHVEPPVIPDPPEYDISDTFIMYAAEESTIEFTQLEDYKDKVITTLCYTAAVDTLDEVIKADTQYYIFSNGSKDNTITLEKGKYIKMNIYYNDKNPEVSENPVGKFNINGLVDLIGDTQRIMY